MALAVAAASAASAVPHDKTPPVVDLRTESAEAGAAAGSVNVYWALSAMFEGAFIPT